jgi:signal transduction histidine kinase
MDQVHTMQEQLFGVEKVAAVSTLAAGAAHDFNNSLTVILGHVQLALDDPAIPATTRADLRTIEEAALSGARMAQELLGLTRQRTGSTRFSNLADAVRTPLDSLARDFDRRRITVVANLESIPVSNVDLEIICQACLNLYLNARDAMLPMGRGRLSVSLRRCDGFAEIVVQDTGTGVPEAFRSLMFQPLQTTKGERGTGLGLSVSRTQLRSMGGDITFETEEGVGTTFRVRLPVEKSSALRPAPEPFDSAQGRTASVSP